MKNDNIIQYFWEELNAYTLNKHRFNDGFKRLVDSSIERALIREKHQGKLISQIIFKKRGRKAKKKKEGEV